MKQKWRDVFDGILDWRSLTPAQHRKALHSMRRNVLEAAELFDEIFEKIPNMTDDPDRQFEILFRENPNCFLVIHKRLESRFISFHKKKRATAIVLEELCGVLAIPVMGVRLLGDDDYVAEMEAKVRRKLKKTGKGFRDYIAEKAKLKLH